MKLREWMKVNDVKIAVLAKKTKKTEKTIYNWLNGKSLPRTKDEYHKIHRITGQKVTPNDFCDIST